MILKSVGQNKLVYPLRQIKNRVNLFNLKSWLTVTAKQYLLDGIDGQLIDELITNSTEF